MAVTVPFMISQLDGTEVRNVLIHTNWLVKSSIRSLTFYII